MFAIEMNVNVDYNLWTFCEKIRLNTNVIQFREWILSNIKTDANCGIYVMVYREA